MLPFGRIQLWARRLGGVSLFIGLLLAAFGGAPRQVATAQGQPQYQRLITVGANGFARQDKVVEVWLNFTPLIAEGGGSGALDPASIRVQEIDGGGDVLDADVPFQFDRAGDYHAANKARGTLVFLMKGSTAANETRRYRVRFDVVGSGFSAPAFTDRVALTNSVGHKGYQSVRVVADGAEYFYHKPGGGFATLLDAGNNDWINWNTTPQGNGDFRGIPNMVHPNDGGYFHPGRNSVTTTVVYDGPLRASFRSASNNNAWQVQWDIFPDYARMTVLKVAANYWFLYEGVPGGQLQPGNDRLTRSNGDSIPASGTWTTDIAGDEWVFVTDQALDRSLYLIHHQEDTRVDGYYADGTAMTVFGFGRNGNQRLLSGLPRQFTFGFVDETTVNGVRPVVNAAYKPLAITGSNDDGDDEPGPICDSQPFSILFSPKVSKVVNGVNLADEDIVRYDAATCEVTTVFDGTAAGLPATANLDAIALKDGDTYFSLLAPATVPGIAGKVDDSDVVAYDGNSFTLYLDGSANGLSTNAEDVDAIAFDEAGKLLLSTTGSYALPGGLKGGDEDLLRFDGGVWTLRFDGSHNAGLAAEDVAAAAVAANGDIYLSVLDGFNVGGINGNAADVFICTPGSLGALNTTCAYSLFWDVAAYGLPAFDAIEVE
jgi:hypothetical protein